MFLAGDAVQLIRDNALENLMGLGPGNLREHYDYIIPNDVVSHLSGMSCHRRGISDGD